MTTERAVAFSEDKSGASPVADQAPAPEGRSEVASGETAEPLAGINSSIRDEVDRQFRLVPVIGTGRRWYDVPYSLLNVLFVGRRYWAKMPKAARRAINRLQNWLLIFNHYDREKIAHPHDPLYNVVVPEDEKVSLPYFWLVEYYSPSHAEDLARRIGSRKWSRADFIRTEGADDAVRQGRQRDGSLGVQDIATLVSHDYQGFFPSAVRMRLPDPFKTISLRLLPLGSALTAVVARFDLTDAAAASLDDALRAEYRPRLCRVKGRLHVRQRMYVALEAVQMKREELHQAGRNWLANELPGLFAIEARASHPVLDLLFTQRFDPFSRKERDRNDMNFDRALGLNKSPLTLIHSPEWKRVRVMDYAFETSNREVRDSGLAMVAKYDDALGRKNEFKYRGDERSEQGIMIDLDFGAPGLITRFGLFELLRIKQIAVARARDQASSMHSRRPVTSAKKLRESVLRSSLDMATVARDIQSLAASANRYEWVVPELATRRRETDRWGKSKKGLLKDWANRQAEDARRLADLDRELLNILDLSSSLNASIEGIRSQRWSLFVALLSLVSSGVAVWLAYLSLIASSAT
ncbi:hypothetical protein MUG94_10365 [Arthrobacter gengyunqii]|uniref:Uncharacterized protein n=1 Tax=Arthrobacter gengyunqii TaxID=2886940 RepID=A0A9X1S866_9MICC|nr:hypothetical protein [Arthrobacter gengyunqii]MCC3271106.1 hypothetical protein [Arthrobacter gengyunqii]UOY94987.1 hypothetical protein MUG94_10365 [Arthrobacter gengyunqii]